MAGVQQSLMEVEPLKPVYGELKTASPAAEGKVFRLYDQGQVWLMPPSLDDWLPEEYLARFVDALVESNLDLSAFYAAHTSRRGAPPFDPRMVLKVVLYGYVTRVHAPR